MELNEIILKKLGFKEDLHNELNLALYHIREHYGAKAELDKVTEELGELIRAVNDWKASMDDGNRMGVLSEMADVYIVLEHLKDIVCVDEAKIELMKSHKVIRQLNRMKGEKGNNEQI